MRIEAFIIHLARAERRRPQVDRLSAQLSMPVTVLDAVDGTKLTDAEVAAVYRRDLHRPHYPFELRRAEIACFLSHRKAWQAIVERGLDAGLVVEDDVEIDIARFGPLLDLGKEQMQGSDFVRFPKKARGETGTMVTQSAVGHIVLPRNPMLGMQAQLVGRPAAETLLPFTEQFDRPVDTLLQMRWLHGARMASALPVVIREVDAELGGTTIQNKNKPVDESVARELLRARYRFAVWLRNVLNTPPTGPASPES